MKPSQNNKNSSEDRLFIHKQDDDSTITTSLLRPHSPIQRNKRSFLKFLYNDDFTEKSYIEDEYENTSEILSYKFNNYSTNNELFIFQETIRKIKENSKRYVQKSNLYLHQIEIDKAICDTIISKEKPYGYIVAATGTGKTITFIETIKRFGVKTLIVTSRINLKNQVKDQFKNYTGILPDICVYNSLEKHLKDHYELIILDEAHRALSKSYNLSVKQFMSRGVIIIGFTATPEFNTKRRKGDLKNLEELFPNGCIYNYDIIQAINEKVLSPVVVLDAVVVDNEIISTIKNFRLKRCSTSDSGLGQEQLNGLLCATRFHKFLAHLYVNSVFEQNRTEIFTKKILIFCATIEHSNSLSEYLNDLLKDHPYFLENKIIPSASINSGLNQKEQGKILEAHKKGRITILCNPLMLTEGYDDPNLDVIIYAIPTRSIIQKKQAIGRVLRKDSNNPNKVALIIDVKFLGLDYLSVKEVLDNKSILGDSSVAEHNIYNSPKPTIYGYAEYKLIQPGQQEEIYHNNKSADMYTDNYPSFNFESNIFESHQFDSMLTNSSFQFVPQPESDNIFEDLDNILFTEDYPQNNPISNQNSWQQRFSQNKHSNNFQDRIESNTNSSPNRLQTRYL